MSDGRYFGKYRGTVVNNVDPMQQGRVQVMVPAVSDILSNWAMPCTPIAGRQQGVFVVPQVGANVWVEYEAGDPQYPIWTGGFWGSAADVPVLALLGVPANPNILLQTTLQHTVALLDLPGPTGGIILKSPTGASIIVNDTGIYITNGKGASIIMVGPTVTVNQGALVVT